MHLQKGKYAVIMTDAHASAERKVHVAQIMQERYLQGKEVMEWNRSQHFFWKMQFGF